jgi:hypothetical protein
MPSVRRAMKIFAEDADEDWTPAIAGEAVEAGGERGERIGGEEAYGGVDGRGFRYTTGRVCQKPRW